MSYVSIHKIEKYTAANRFIDSGKSNLQIAGCLDFAAGVFNRGVSSMDAGSKPTGMYSRRPLLEIPAAKSAELTTKNIRTFETIHSQSFEAQSHPAQNFQE